MNFIRAFMSPGSYPDSQPKVRQSDLCIIRWVPIVAFDVLAMPVPFVLDRSVFARLLLLVDVEDILVLEEAHLIVPR